MYTRVIIGSDSSPPSSRTRDELHEEALLALTKCHAAVGERSQALRVYRRFADPMRAELEAEPDDETTSYFVQLQAGAGA